MIVSGGFDWVNVKDVIAGARAAAERGQRGRSYILSGMHLDLAELIERAAIRAGRPKPLLVLPPGLVRPFAVFPVLLGRLRGREALFTAESLATLGSSARFSHARAREEFGYSPHPAHEAVDELIDWFVESGRVRSRRAAIPGEWRTEFERQLRAFPLEGSAASHLVAPLLAEIARADAVVDASEQEMLDALATESGGGPERLAESERAQLLAALPTGQRESLLLLASVLAWVDEEQAAEERAALERLRDEMMIPHARAAELDDWGRDYIIDQHLDAAYADGMMDAAERKRVEELAGRLEITPFRLSRLDQRARKRNGLD